MTLKMESIKTEYGYRLTLKICVYIYEACLNSAAQVGFRRIRLMSLGSYRSTD